MTYASNTSVPVERSKSEIERLLTRYGASKFMSMWDQERAGVAFEMCGRAIRMTLPLPKESDSEFKSTHRRGYETKLGVRSGTFFMCCAFTRNTVKASSKT
jgi:hypothetical protein